jgi:hypothetical protein
MPCPPRDRLKMKHPFDEQHYGDYDDELQDIIPRPADNKQAVPRDTPGEIQYAANCPTDHTQGVPRGTPTSAATADYWATRIAEGWNKTVRSILMVAKDCAEASQKLDDQERDKLHERLPFHRTTFSKLASIGRHDALYDESVLTHLPPHRTIIERLLHCSLEEIRRAIKAGVVHPDCRRDKVEAWRKETPFMES